MQIKHIAIDGNEANISNRVGSNVYAFEIIKHLEKITKKRRTLHFTILLSSPPVKDLPKQRQHWRYRIVSPKPFWTQWALPLHLFLNKNKYNLLFTPGHYAPRISAIPYVSSVMDLAYLKYPNQFRPNDLLQLKNWTHYSVKNAKKIITISNFSKQEIISHYNKKPEDIIVAYPATQQIKSANKTQIKSFFKKHKINGPYFLYLGTLQPRKNIIKLIEAFEIFSREKAFSSLRKKRRRTNLKKQIQPKLVIAGKIGWLADDILKKIKTSKFHKNIVLTGYVPNKIKPALFKYATCSVLVGLYEGFGIPPLESLTHGTIPIVSKTTSLPEVVGRAGIRVNPEESTEIANGLKKSWQLSVRGKAVFRRKAKNQIKKFSWENSAKIVLDTLEKI